MSERQFTIGFSNLSERVPFAVEVREGLEAAAAQHANLKLIVRDNDVDNQRALSNVHEFAAVPVDLAIIYHIDEKLGSTLYNLLVPKKIPIIAIDIPIRWTTFFGINNQKAGFLAGEALGQWAHRHWDGKIDKILAVTESRGADIVNTRISSAVEGIISQIGVDKSGVFYVNGGTSIAEAADVVRPVLERWAEFHHIAIACYNDDTALGALQAAEMLGRQSDVAVIGQGANLAVDEFKKPGSRFIASTDYHPEKYGEQVIDLALRMLRGERVPQQNLIAPVCLTIDDA